MSADLGSGKARSLRQIGTTGSLRMARLRDLPVVQNRLIRHRRVS
jgi:hypothetical protein